MRVAAWFLNDYEEPRSGFDLQPNVAEGYIGYQVAREHRNPVRVASLFIDQIPKVAEAATLGFVSLTASR